MTKHSVFRQTFWQIMLLYNSGLRQSKKKAVLTDDLLILIIDEIISPLNDLLKQSHLRLLLLNTSLNEDRLHSM